MQTLLPNFKELLTLRLHARGQSFGGKKRSQNIMAGHVISPFLGQGLEFEEVRTYTPGDDVRYIDWHLTARTGKPHLKLFSEEKERCVFLAVDSGAHMNFGTRGTFKNVQAARLASLLGWSALGAGEKVGGFTFGTKETQLISPTRGNRSLFSLFKQLCDRSKGEPLETTMATQLEELARKIPKGSIVFVLSDFSNVDESLENALRALRKKATVHLFAVDDVADKELPQVGNALFSGFGKKGLFNTFSKKGQKRYTDIWNEKRTLLKKMAKAQGIRVVEILTSDEPKKALQFSSRRGG